MVLAVISIAVLLNVIYCHDSESSEYNRIEISPFYDTVIYHDIADIINEVENNAVSPFDVLSESESEENVEDLLSEYQRSLDRAHKQRKNTLNNQHSKTKNKVPPLRHDQYFKTKPGLDGKYENVYFSNRYHNPSPYKFPQVPFENPYDVLIPLSSKTKYSRPETTTTSIPIGNNELLRPFEKIFLGEKNIPVQPFVHKQFEPLKSCYCQKAPCDCNCKECIVDNDHTDSLKINNFEDDKKLTWPHTFYDSHLKKSDRIENIKDMLPDNTLNIRVRVDVQLPKFQELVKSKLRSKDKILEQENISRELSTAINLPFPFLNFPIPLDLVGYQKMSKYNKEDTSPLHKLTIHKKKKSRTNNNTTKKHRKKIITFHNIKLEQLAIPHLGDNNTNETYTINNSSAHTNESITKPAMLKSENNTLANKSEDSNQTRTDNIFLAVNSSSITLNATDDTHKDENSIEFDYSKFPSITTKVPVVIRTKRNAPNNTAMLNITRNNETVPNSKEKYIAKKSDKNIQTDDELLYWPNVTRSLTSNIYSKNITTFILENEHKKSKVNISKETIRRNHTMALEQAIFGNVDWDNMNEVAPALMSFVGKYICGVLTFCSQEVCHSMNCAHKTCIHRVCIPADRLNNKGHCAGSSSNDSVASMESIMDLPSNVAFEIVDILENKMLGKLFGKATFCINTKCITLSASKKNFNKFRCTVKEINPAGHCNNFKNVKVM